MALSAYGPESPASERVRLNAVIVKLIAAAFADAYPPASVIAEVIVHVPASTKATRPEEELMVHTEVVELEYDFVPLPTPALGVAVIVGLVPALKAYVEVYEPASIVKVLEVSAVTFISIVGETDALYVASPPSVARTEQVPIFEALAVSVEPEIEQYNTPSTTS